MFKTECLEQRLHDVEDLGCICFRVWCLGFGVQGEQLKRGDSV